MPMGKPMPLSETDKFLLQALKEGSSNENELDSSEDEMKFEIWAMVDVRELQDDLEKMKKELICLDGKNQKILLNFIQTLNQSVEESEQAVAWIYQAILEKALRSKGFLHMQGLYNFLCLDWWIERQAADLPYGLDREQFEMIWLNMWNLSQGRSMALNAHDVVG